MEDLKYTKKGIENSIDELHEKVDSNFQMVTTQLNNIDKTLLVNTLSLQEHMKRTNLNEAKLELFELEVAPALNAYKFLAIFIKILIAIAAPIGAIIGFYFQYIKK